MVCVPMRMARACIAVMYTHTLAFALPTKWPYHQARSGSSRPPNRALMPPPRGVPQVPPLLAHLSGMLDTMYENAVRDAKRLASDNRLPTVLGVPSTPRSSPTQFCEAPPPQVRPRTGTPTHGHTHATHPPP